MLHRMESQNSQSEVKASAASSTPAVTSCRKKKKEDATFLEDVKDHIDEFIHASMDEHMSCFTKTVRKMFGMSKIVAQRNSERMEVESVLALQTTLFSFFILTILLLQALSATNTANSLSNMEGSQEAAAMDLHKTSHGRIIRHYPKKINCNGACAMRCRKASRKNVCSRACKSCCMRCHCVPPGTYGNKNACPCYARLKTHGGRPKCP
ncbi:hypothetical protein Ancab_036634 [Ancistrocladus abbreviatus]